MTTQTNTGLANIKEAAQYIGISRDAIYKLLNSGELPFKMIGSHKRIPWTVIREFCEEVQENKETTA